SWGRPHHVRGKGGSEWRRIGPVRRLPPGRWPSFHTSVRRVPLPSWGRTCCCMQWVVLSEEGCAGQNPSKRPRQAGCQSAGERRFSTEQVLRCWLVVSWCISFP